MAQMASMTGARTGRARGLPNILLLVSVCKPDLRRRRDLFIIALVLRLASVGLLAWIGYIHWVLWQNEGYKTIPTYGPFFLVDAIAGIVLALALLAWPRPLAGLLSAGFIASTILALVISLTLGPFGFKETISANYVILALVVESIALVIVLVWTFLAARAIPSRS